MAIFHFTHKIISRRRGQSVVGSAAYRAADRLRDERLGRTFDYTPTQGKIVHSEILAPDQAPAWVYNREALWNAVEAAERRKDAQLAREVELALPKELDKETNIALAREYIQHQYVAKGMIADWNVHDDGSYTNPHVHVLLTLRDVSPEGFGKKNRSWNGPCDDGFVKAPLRNDVATKNRAEWADHVNRYLEASGYADQKIDHRSYAEQGIEQEPTRHLGKERAAMLREQEDSRVAQENRLIEHRNLARREARSWTPELVEDYGARVMPLRQRLWGAVEHVKTVAQERWQSLRAYIQEKADRMAQRIRLERASKAYRERERDTGHALDSG